MWSWMMVSSVGVSCVSLQDEDERPSWSWSGDERYRNDASERARDPMARRSS